MNALGLPANFPLRPSQADLDHHHQVAVRLYPENRDDLNRRHKTRINAWLARRDHQKDWYRRTGIDTLNRRQSRLLADKHRIERELMELMIGSDRTATDA